MYELGDGKIISSQGSLSCESTIMRFSDTDGLSSRERGLAVISVMTFVADGPDIRSILRMPFVGELMAAIVSSVLYNLCPD